MKERLVQLLDLEQLSPSKFADIIGVQRSSVSHVISGRNNPSYDFIQKTLKAFPGLNADWLILGKGTMYEQMGRSVSGNLFETPITQPEDSFEQTEPDKGVEEEQITPSATLSEEKKEEAEAGEGADYKLINNEENEPEAPEGKRVTQVMVFYDDDTFKSFRPSQ